MRNFTLALTLAAATFAVAQTRTELIAPMTGAGKAKATFKTRGAEAELQVEGENMRRNTTFKVTIGNGKFVGTVTTDALGRFAARRAWRGTFPQIKVGDTVVVRYATTQAVAVSGTFRVK